jgi:hypothetical protein
MSNHALRTGNCQTGQFAVSGCNFGTAALHRIGTTSPPATALNLPFHNNLRRAMKFFTWISMSILVALVISWPLVLLLGVSREAAGLISLAGGGLLMLFWKTSPPKQ